MLRWFVDDDDGNDDEGHDGKLVWNVATATVFDGDGDAMLMMTTLIFIVLIFAVSVILMCQTITMWTCGWCLSKV